MTGASEYRAWNDNKEGAVNKSKWAAVPATLLLAMLAINPVKASAQTAPENALTTIPAKEELTWPRVIKNAAATLTVY